MKKLANWVPSSSRWLSFGSRPVNRLACANRRSPTLEGDTRNPLTSLLLTEH
jgi:hypothetical protein